MQGACRPVDFFLLMEQIPYQFLYVHGACVWSRFPITSLAFPWKRSEARSVSCHDHSSDEDHSSGEDHSLTLFLLARTTRLASLARQEWFVLCGPIVSTAVDFVLLDVSSVLDDCRRYLG